MKPETLAEIKKNITEADKRLTELKDDLAKAEKAGLDVTERKKDFTDLLKKVSLLKATYL
jgi:hypothetical protein